MKLSECPRCTGSLVSSPYTPQLAKCICCGQEVELTTQTREVQLPLRYPTGVAI